MAEGGQGRAGAEVRSQPEVGVTVPGKGNAVVMWAGGGGLRFGEGCAMRKGGRLRGRGAFNHGSVGACACNSNTKIEE